MDRKGVNKLRDNTLQAHAPYRRKRQKQLTQAHRLRSKKWRQAFERRRNLIVSLAKEVPGFEVNQPEGAFYLFPKCSYYYGKTDGTRTIENADDLAMYLLEVGHVACVGGTSFGAPECIRMSLRYQR